MQDYNVNLMGFPGALVQPMSPHELISTIVFQPLQRRTGQGILLDTVEFGSFRMAWNVCSQFPITFILTF